MSQRIKYPRLNAKGQEILDSKPTVLYMQVDSDSGEVIQEGRPRPRSVQDIYDRATARHFTLSDGYYDDEDDDSLPEEDDGSLPLHSPHTDGFVDAMGPTLKQAEKLLKKRGYTVQEPLSPPASHEGSDEPPASSRKGPAGKKSPVGPDIHEGSGLADPDDQ